MALLFGIPRFALNALSSLSLLQWTVILAVFLVSLYIYLTWNYGVFEKKGLASRPPSLFFGNIKDLMFQTKSMMDYHQELYKAFKGHE